MQRLLSVEFILENKNSRKHCWPRIFKKTPKRCSNLRFKKIKCYKSSWSVHLKCCGWNWNLIEKLKINISDQTFGLFVYSSNYFQRTNDTLWYQIKLFNFEKKFELFHSALSTPPLHQMNCILKILLIKSNKICFKMNF